MRMIRLAVLGFALAFTAAGVTGSHAVDKSTTNKQTKARKSKGIVGTTTGGMMGVSALTAQECTGLGGTINSPSPDMKCKAGEEACFTTDKHGVIKARCIDEVAAD